MSRNRKVVNIAPYLGERSQRTDTGDSRIPEAPSPPRERLTPLAVCGLAGVLLSIVFLVYVAIRAAEVAVVDGVVLAVIASDVALGVFAGLMIIAAPKLRSLAGRTASRQTASPVSNVGAAEAPNEPISLEDVRRRRAAVAGAVIRCASCGAAFSVSDAVCASCGTVSRIA